MAELSGLKTIEEVAKHYMFMHKMPEEELIRCLQLTIDGLKKIKLFHLRGFETVVKLTVSAIKTIDLPDDYLNFIAVAIPVDGEYWFLTSKGRMVFSQDALPLDTDDGEGVDIPDGYYSDYQSSGGINREGYYKIDEKNRRIVLNSLQSTSTEVFLLYYSTGINAAGTATYVPDRAREAVLAYIDFGYAMGEKDYRAASFLEDQYNKRVDELRYLEMPRLSELRDALYEVMNPLPQR